MYMRQSLYRCALGPVSGWSWWTRADTRLRGPDIQVAHFSQIRRLSDKRAFKMSKKALILIADGTEEMEL